MTWRKDADGTYTDDWEGWDQVYAGAYTTTYPRAMKVDGTKLWVLTQDPGANPDSTSSALRLVTLNLVNKPFVSGQTLGTLRNNFTGWVGMKITVVGPSDLYISHLGRWVVEGNTGTHTVKLVNASTGADVAGGSVSIDTAGAMAAAFKYAHVNYPYGLSRRVLCEHHCLRRDDRYSPIVAW